MSYMYTDYEECDVLIQTAIAYYQFEAIHPFLDGNSRMGRLIISLYLHQRGLTKLPNLYISEFLEKYRREYYEALNLVTREQDWLNWISFFLRAVFGNKQKSLKKRVDKITNLYR